MLHFPCCSDHRIMNGRGYCCYHISFNAFLVGYGIWLLEQFRVHAPGTSTIDIVIGCTTDGTVGGTIPTDR
jgi:hypothetical protein